MSIPIASNIYYLFLENFKNKDYIANKKIYTQNELSFSSTYNKNKNVKGESLKVKYLKTLRNEIYAHHGYKFEDENLNEFFSEFTWYKPIEKFDIKNLNCFELENIKIISEQEKMIKEIRK